MRHLVIASVVTGSTLVATAASAQQLQYGTSPAPAPTYAPAPVQPAPTAPAPAQPPSAPPQYGQPAPTQAAPPAPQPQPQPQPQAQPQYGQPAPQAPQQQQPPQYAPPQQPQQQPQQYGQPQQPGYGAPQPAYGGSTQPAEVSPPIADTGGAWRPSNAKFIIAGERLFGISSLNGTLSQPGGTSQDGNALMVNLLWGNSSVRIATYGAINPYAMPMLTFHGVVGGGVTIGGGIGYSSTTGSHDVGDGSTIDDPTRSAVAVAPRIGYLLSTSSTFGIWMKGGITYFSQNEESNVSSNKVSISGIALNIDPMLVLAPVPHVAILLGPVLDIGLSGTMANEGAAGNFEDDLKLSNFGVAAGLALLI